MINFKCDSEKTENLFRRALAGLDSNSRCISEKTGRVLTEGGVYPGIWMECAPLEGLIYAPVEPEVARNNHTAFFKHQRNDGQFPASISERRINFGQIQQVVPMAETAYELGVMTGDEELLRQAYSAWSRWDCWITRYRDSRKLGVCEAFCEYDTGHDNSFRFRGLPKFCPEKEAGILPDFPVLPCIAPDLTATMYGGRVALAGIAGVLGDTAASSMWLEKAEVMKKSLFEYCYDPETEFFYDRNAQGELVKCVCDGGIRVLMEHAVEQELFDRIFHRWIINPEAFWTPYPMPSVAACDTGFVHPPPENCWSGASQALQALRTPRWMEHYGKFSALDHLMRQWLCGMLNAADFMQQMDPFSGEFSTSPGYSPAMCCAIDFISRIAGVKETVDDLAWGCAGLSGCTVSEFETSLFKGGSAKVICRNGTSKLFLNGREIFSIHGQARCFSNRDGGDMRIAALNDGRIVISGADIAPRELTLLKDEVYHVVP